MSASRLTARRLWGLGLLVGLLTVAAPAHAAPADDRLRRAQALERRGELGAALRILRPARSNTEAGKHRVARTALAVSTRIGTDLLSTLTSMFNPLPAIALLPLALLWFGLGIPSLIFVIIHSVLWAVALNTHTGFLAVAEAQRMAGQNYGLRGIRYVTQILIPAAFPSILAGLKIGWAFAWRTLIAAELVFGVSSRSGGLGWFIFENRNQLETAYVFAGLTAVIIIGLLVESVVFRTVETHTVRKWGMQR